MTTTDSSVQEIRHYSICKCAACGASSQEEGVLSEATSGGTTSPQSQTAGGTSISLSSVTGDGYQLGDSMISGYKWSGTALTYSFTDAGGDYGYNDYGSTFRKLNATQQAAATDALEQLSAVSGLTFTQLTGSADRDADIRMAVGAAPSTAWAYLPTSAEQGGDAWFNPNDYNSPTIGSYAYSTFLHELGHSMGLKHGHETSFAGKLTAAFDSHEYSLMTYHSSVGGGLYYSNYNGSGPQTFMIADIQALQFMYGANFNTNAGDTLYTFSTTTGEMSVNGVGQGASTANIVFRTVWDGNGNDTYDLSNYTTNLAIDLTAGGYSDFNVGGNAQRAQLDYNKFSRGHVFNAAQYQNDARSLIENAKGGTGNDTLLGNAAGNSLSGGGGNDTLTGAAGNDTLDGGAGTDVARFTLAFSAYAASMVGSVLTLTGEGVDSILSSIESAVFSDRSYSYADLLALAGGGSVGSGDPVTTTLNGSSAKDTLAGSASDDIIYGLADLDSLTGGAGSDTIDGGDGNDKIDGGAGTDSLIGSGGNDTVWGRDDNDRLDGSTGNDKMYGDAGDDTILGGVGNDVIDAGIGADSIDGGAGNDRILGGDGNDILVGGDGGDELDAGKGDDTLTGGASVDRLLGGDGIDVLTGGDDNDYLDGGTGNDILTAGAGKDTLLGGTGNDSLTGGTGDDMLTGGGGLDRFIFVIGDGIDTIRDFSRTDDIIDLTGFGLTSVADLTVTQRGSLVEITEGAFTLKLMKMTTSLVTNDIFDF